MKRPCRRLASQPPLLRIKLLSLFPKAGVLYVTVISTRISRGSAAGLVARARVAGSKGLGWLLIALWLGVVFTGRVRGQATNPPGRLPAPPAPLAPLLPRGIPQPNADSANPVHPTVNEAVALGQGTNSVKQPSDPETATLQKIEHFKTLLNDTNLTPGLRSVCTDLLRQYNEQLDRLQSRQGLETGDSGSWMFELTDIKNLYGMIVILRVHPDPISSNLWQNLSNEEQLLLRDVHPPRLGGTQAEVDVAHVVQDVAPFVIVQCLNKIVSGPCLYEPERVKGVVLPPDVAALIKQTPSGPNFEHVNRLLLEDVFPV